MKIYADYIKKLTSSIASFIFVILFLTIILHTEVFSQYANPDPVPLLTADTYGALASTGITGSANVNGDIGTITGTIDGTIIASGTNWGVNDPHTVQAQADLAAALSDADSRSSDLTISNALGEQTLERGVYDGGALDLASGTTLTLNGSATDVFIIKAASTLIINTNSTVSLTGGAVWSNVFWYVGSSATIYNGSTFNGIILAVTSITLNAGATQVNAKLLANGGAVTINSDVLPVELTSFTAEINNGVILLNWQTATEVNNYGFEVERQYQVSSIEYQDAEWEYIGFVQGHGTTNSPKNYSFVDDFTLNHNPNLTHVSYSLKQIDNDGTISYSKIVTVDLTNITSVEDEINYEFSLEQNYPNPFNPITTIKYSIAEENKVGLKIYNILGSEIKTLVNETKAPGNYEVELNGSNLASGIYFYKLEAGINISIKKLTLLK